MNAQLEQLQSQSKVQSRSATIRDVGVLLLLPLLQRRRRRLYLYAQWLTGLVGCPSDGLTVVGLLFSHNGGF